MSCCFNKRAQWKREKLNAAREAAQKKANEQGKTMAIIKEGSGYKSIPASDYIGEAIEYISQHN